MKRTVIRILRAAAVLLLVPATGVVVDAGAARAAGLTPKQIADAQKVIGFAVSAYDLAELAGLVPSELERATTRIINAVNAAKTELLNEIDELTAAEVDACKDSALTDAENLARMTPTQLDNFATRAVDCVNRAVNFINALDSQRAVNQVSFAMNTVAPLALIARARLGLGSDFLRANVRAGNEATMWRLAPNCVNWIDEESGRPLYWNVVCTSFNGTTGSRTSVYPFTDYTPQIDAAMRNTSYELSKTLLTT